MPPIMPPETTIITTTIPARMMNAGIDAIAHFTINHTIDQNRIRISTMVTGLAVSVTPERCTGCILNPP